ncbi:hypothetical protein FGB62_29g124 [Gracilaria domingensis]|nr:hypothetical protein FGB62_29g124 [Gracilaria domingensis]
MSAKHNLISGPERKQYLRYADLALKLVNNPGMVEKFEHMCEHKSKVGLTHFSYTELYKLEAHVFWFAMECIRRPVVKDPKTYASGRFEDVRTFFFGRALAMYRAARTEAFRISEDRGPLILVSEFVSGRLSHLRKPRRTKEQADDDDGSVVDLKGDAGPPGVRRSQRKAAKSSTNSAAGKGGFQKRKKMESDEDIQTSQPPRKKRKLFLPSKLVEFFRKIEVHGLMREMNERVMSKKGVKLMVMEEDEDAFVDDEEMKENEEETRLGFDDENPEELSEEEGLREKGDPYDGGEYPACETLLKANHMAGRHRSEVLMEDDLRSVHHALYWHASRARYQELGTTKGPVLGFPLPTNRPAGTSDEDALWLAAV